MSVSVNNRIDAGELSAENTVPRKVLLLDEQAHVVRVIRLNLERCGFQVESAEDIHGAMQLMRDCRFDALISTEERPVAEIMELCRRGSELLATHGSGTEGMAVPLMLINCRDEDDLSDTVAGFERLGQPVSLKRIVERLHETLGDATGDFPD